MSIRHRERLGPGPGRPADFHPWVPLVERRDLLAGSDRLPGPDADRDVLCHIDVLAGERAIGEPVDDDPAARPTADRPAAGRPRVGVGRHRHYAVAERKQRARACVVDAEVNAAMRQAVHPSERVDVVEDDVPEGLPAPGTTLVGGGHCEALGAGTRRHDFPARANGPLAGGDGAGDASLVAAKAREDPSAALVKSVGGGRDDRDRGDRELVGADVTRLSLGATHAALIARWTVAAPAGDSVDGGATCPERDRPRRSSVVLQRAKLGITASTGTRSVAVTQFVPAVV